MNNVHKYIVKIISDEGTSSGFIYFPPGAGYAYAYVFTARHALLKDGSTDIQKDRVQIHFFDEDRTIYTVAEEDTILYGDNNIDDIAVIVINIRSIPAEIETGEGLKLAILTGKEKACIIPGFPKAVGSKTQRTLYEGTLLSDKDYANQVQVSVTDPVTSHYNADDLVEGYSGSGIMIESAGNTYACAVFSKYEENTKRILANNFSSIKKIIVQNGLSEPVLYEVETDVSILADIKKLKANTDRVLDRIKNQVGKIRLDRTELKVSIKEKIGNDPFLLISGKAGIGKSALVKHALSLTGPEYEVIAIQGEQLDKPGIAEIFMAPPFGISQSFEKVLNSKGMNEKKIILIDSIEKILETSNADTIIDFFTLLKTRPDLKIILTCRSYAMEQLTIRFLQHFLSLTVLKIPDLSEEELKEVCVAYPGIKKLLEKPSLRKILSIPFNLDKATLLEEDVLEGKVNSEADFKKIMWEYVIENRQNEPDTKIRAGRAFVFSEIALLRAKQMTPYVHMNTGNLPLLQQLIADNLIEKNPVAPDQYAASHDIYEDWALTRFIEEKYQDFIVCGGDLSRFFSVIGYATAIRRGFRIWILEKLQCLDYNIKELIRQTLQDTGLQQYWKDEIIIAIMQSPYSETFLKDNKELLTENDLHLFKRTILLLNVACQEPDLSYLKFLEEDQKNHIYRNAYLKPAGKAWENMIGFILANISELESQYSLIIPFLLQWEKKLTPFGLPPESKNAGLIIMAYLKYTPARENGYTTGKHNLKECIRLLFRLAGILRVEVKALLEQALAIDKRERRSGEYEIAEKVTKEVLSHFYSSEVCIVYPDLVIKIAEKEWFYYPPTAEEMEEMLEGSPFRTIPTGLQKEEMFGITKEHIYPPSPYQTPVFNLLLADNKKALAFIVKLFNHSLEAFLGSDFLNNDSEIWPADLRQEITIALPCGEIVTQQGTRALWSMYRGTFMATPYLLQSVLMALEKWLYMWAEFASDKDKTAKSPHIKEQLEFAFDYLLKESRSVATTSIMVSVATAFPDLLAGKILPLLNIKQFYRWDLHRVTNEHKAFEPLGSSKYAKFMQEELYKSNQLPHRQLHLETLFLKLSLGAYANELKEILDNFYKEEPKDDDWKFSLNRMDREKQEIVGEVENGFILKTKIDDDLKPKAAAAKKQMDEITPLSRATNWGIKKIKKEQVEKDGIAEWRLHYTILSSPGELTLQSRVYFQPAVIAAVGVRDYFNDLDKEELSWCIQKIFFVVEYELTHRNAPFEGAGEVGAFESEPAFITLVELVCKCTGADQLKAKELLFYSLLFMENHVDRKELINKVKNDLWDVAPDFAFACVVGIIKYAEISELRFRIMHYNQRDDRHIRIIDTSWYNKKWVPGFIKNIFRARKQKKNGSIKEEWINQYTSGLTSITTGVVMDAADLNFDEFRVKDHSPFFLIQALDLIQPGSDNDGLQKYCSVMIRYISANLEKQKFQNDLLPYELLQTFESYIALFLLKQPEQVALAKFKELFEAVLPAEKENYPRKKMDLFKGCLEDIISELRNGNSPSTNFGPLWQYLLQAVKESGISYYSDLILLDYIYWNGDERDWKPLHGKTELFKEAIVDLGRLKSSVKLLSGIGFTVLMPEGIVWLAALLDSHNLDEKNATAFTEKLVVNIFYDKSLRNTVRSNAQLRESFIKILDKLIDQNSASAFLIREDFISLN